MPTSRDYRAPHGYVDVGEDEDQPRQQVSTNEPIVCGPRPRVASSIILAPDGKNFIPWKTIMPSVLDGEPFAWDVVCGRLNMPDSATAATPEGRKQKQNFLIGNRAARYILINSIHPDLAVTLFLDNAEDVEAQEIWRRIKIRFQHADGTRKSLSMAKFLRFRYQPGASVRQNLLAFKKIVYEMNEAGFQLEDDLTVSRLLEALPSSWEPFRQAWSARKGEDKHLDTLT
jgi:hypothetical protein